MVEDVLAVEGDAGTMTFAFVTPSQERENGGTSLIIHPESRREKMGAPRVWRVGRRRGVNLDISG